MVKSMPRVLVNAVVITAVVLSSLLMFNQKANAADTNCSPISGYSSICLDPTTGYGPVVYVYNSAGSIIYATGVVNICVTNTGVASPKNTDAGYYVAYGNGSGNVFLHVSNVTACLTGMIGTATMTQTQMDYVRWYSNSVNTQRAKVVL